MNEKEAIERLKCMNLFMRINDEENENKFLDCDYIANEMAVMALEKQIPKKPFLDNIYHQQYYCPHCQEFLTRKNEEKPHHCTCGQAIDWSK